jgi:Protein of unknown function (DUF1566)
MSEGKASKPAISLGDHFGDVVVRVNRATIEVSAAGYVVATSPNGVEWRAAANDTAEKAKAVPEIGDEMEDGTIYAGISPDTGKELYTTKNDTYFTYNFNQAAEYATDLNKQTSHGHDDWRVPSNGELNVLWKNRSKGKLAGTFNETGSYPAGSYWSSFPDCKLLGWGQRFSDGVQGLNYTAHALSLRCVR